MTTPIAPVDVRHLRYFLAAAQHGSFRKAGMALGIQESSISRRIRDLEDRLGASLFHRYNGGVRLTLAGQRFCCRARAIIRQIGDGAADVSAIGRAEDGHVRIGISVSLATHFLAELLRTFQQRHTGVRLDWM
ncbi:LysR family transcriptional regulator [Ancylobacter lacus]|uniref:LysR family transcriptional regulator n=1 Tax=Ancylobacter lacus TaxID=2579970 RepID=UPI001BCD3661|nr:LysR family transcriptional regulator [Ancylobacter lacus]MBS7540011.1 LysR family transcriptional regulator [Ancylobacter lacus]